MDEGWNMHVKKINNVKYIHMTKDGNRLIFAEGKRRNLCLLKDVVHEKDLIAKIVEDDEDEEIIPISTSFASMPNDNPSPAIIEDDENDTISERKHHENATNTSKCNKSVSTGIEPKLSSVSGKRSATSNKCVSSKK